MICISCWTTKEAKNLYTSDFSPSLLLHFGTGKIVYGVAKVIINSEKSPN